MHSIAQVHQSTQKKIHLTPPTLCLKPGPRHDYKPGPRYNYKVVQETHQIKNRSFEIYHLILLLGMN